MFTKFRSNEFAKGISWHVRLFASCQTKLGRRVSSTLLLFETPPHFLAGILWGNKMNNAVLRLENEDYLEREDDVRWWLRGRNEEDQRARVLLIEDDRTTRRLVSAALETRCTVFEAPSGNKGLEKLAAHKPDVIFLDLQLPDQDGQALLRTIMRHDPQAYVVLFSSHCDKDNIREAMISGAKGFVSKPFNLDLMVHYINQRFRP